MTALGTVADRNWDAEPSTLEVPLRARRAWVWNVRSAHSYGGAPSAWDGDLFHPHVPDAFVVDVFARMSIADQHVYHILTKRPARMRALLSSPGFRAAWFEARNKRAVQDDVQRLWNRGVGSSALIYPLPNVRLGTVAEDQRRAAERVPLLLDTPAAGWFVSCEPLLGLIDLRPYLPGHDLRRTMFSGGCLDRPGPGSATDGLAWVPRRGVQWVVVGGGHGPGANPAQLDWAEDVARQCQAAGTACVVKQTRVGRRRPRRHPDKRAEPLLEPADPRSRLAGETSEKPL